MSQNLQYLLDIARKYREKHAFSPEERQTQVRSFAYGNTRLENDEITKHDIDNAVESLHSECEHPVCP